jgi:hypothetical protein
MQPHQIIALAVILSSASVLGQTDSPPAVAGKPPVSGDFLNDPRPGYWVGGTEQLTVWWCESGWKIGRERSAPIRPSGAQPAPVSVSAAGGEYEAAQVILRPERDGELLSTSAGALRKEGSDNSPVSVRLDEVAYVEVIRPTDKTCQPGWHPDPLPPLHTPLRLVHLHGSEGALRDGVHRSPGQ